MPVGLSAPDNLLPVRGFQLAAVDCGIKSGTNDLVLLLADKGTQMAAVFTKNAYCAAPVLIAKEHLQQSSCRALIVNAGNANAGTGKQGELNALNLCQHVADCLAASGTDISQREVLPFSTGVIGEPLPVELMRDGIDRMVPQLDQHHWLAAAEAIMTTDTVAKGISEQCTIDGELITLTGIAKGSGMIHPDMATLLAFVATDAAVDPYSLQQIIQSVSDKTFNCVSVDGDTSTNDSFMLMASGVAGNRLLSPSHPQWNNFVAALQRVALHLAHAIIRDGEGATRFIEIEVSGGASIADCRQVAFTVAHSPLVKTAFFAGDPNLGRILAAVGRSKVNQLSMQSVSLQLGDVPVIEQGEPAVEYSEEKAAAVMAAEDVVIQLDLGMGTERISVWTTDLSYDYVKINAEYRS